MRHFVKADQFAFAVFHLLANEAYGAVGDTIEFGCGADAESRAPMAVAVIGGLVSSTVLSLVYVPVVFSLIDALQTRVKRLLGRLLVDQAESSANDAMASE